MTARRSAVAENDVDSGGYVEWLLYLGIAVTGFGLVLGAVPMAAVGVLIGITAFGRGLPRGALVASAAAAILWSNAAVVLPGRVGLPAAVGLLPQVLLAAVVVGRIVARRLPMVTTSAFRVLLLHGAALAMAAIIALDHGPVMGAIISFIIEGVVLWFLVVNAINSESEMERVTAAVVGVCAIIGLVSITQFATGSYDNDYLGFAQIDDSRAELLDEAASTGDEVLLRLSGPIGEQNRYAQSMLVVVPLALGLSRVRTSGRLWPLLAVLPIVAAVALTGSRGAVLGLVATLAVMAYLRLVSMRSVVVVIVAGLLAVSILPGYRDRVFSAFTAVEGIDNQTSEVDGSTLSRVTENIAAVDMFVDHPLFGVGPSGYPRQYERYAERVGLLVKDQARQPHNLYLGKAAETGLVGLVTFVAIPAVVLVRLGRLWRATRSSNSRRAAMAAGYISAIMAYLATGVFLHLAFERYYWMLLALADAAATVGLRAIAVEAVEPPDETALVAASS